MALGPPIVEACVDSIESALMARAAGADRLELCASLDVGGTTPPPDQVAACVERTGIPVHVMVRPRGGGFVYDAAELARMRRDIEDARSAGAAALVLGLLDAAGRVDVAHMRELVERAVHARCDPAEGDAFARMVAAARLGPDASRS